jgi:uncharacterized phage protein gp47/JayE
MSYNRPSLQTIYDRIKADIEARVTNNVKIPRVSLLGILAAVFAGAIFLVYGFIENVIKQMFLTDAEEWGLKRWGIILNMPRKTAKQSEGKVKFTGTAGYTVAAGTKVSDSNGTVYTTQSSFVTDTSADVTALSELAGDDYNTTDTELQLVNPDPNVDSVVTVISGFDTGSDIETLVNWRLRLLQRLQNPPSSGTEADYVRWALAVDGVSKAWCFGADDWAGAGTLGVLVADANLQPVSAGILSNVEAYIDSVKPIPARTDYVNITADEIDIYIKLKPYDQQELKRKIINNLTDLFLLESAPGGTILISQIRTAIASASPDDFEITDITRNGASIGVANITTTVPHCSRLRTVYFVSF